MKIVVAILFLVLLAGCAGKRGGAPASDGGVDGSPNEDVTTASDDGTEDVVADVAPPPTVGALLGRVSQDEIATTIAALSDPESGGFSTRYTGSPGFGDVTDYLVSKLLLHAFVLISRFTQHVETFNSLTCLFCFCVIAHNKLM